MKLKEEIILKQSIVDLVLSRNYKEIVPFLIKYKLEMSKIRFANGDNVLQYLRKNLDYLSRNTKYDVIDQLLDEPIFKTMALVTNDRNMTLVDDLFIAGIDCSSILEKIFAGLSKKSISAEVNKQAVSGDTPLHRVARKIGRNPSEDPWAIKYLMNTEGIKTDLLNKEDKIASDYLSDELKEKFGLRGSNSTANKLKEIISEKGNTQKQIYKKIMDIYSRQPNAVLEARFEEVREGTVFHYLIIHKADKVVLWLLSDPKDGEAFRRLAQEPNRKGLTMIHFLVVRNSQQQSAWKLLQSILALMPEDDILVQPSNMRHVPLDVAIDRNKGWAISCLMANAHVRKDFVIYADLMQHEELLAQYEEVIDDMGNTLFHYLIERTDGSDEYTQGTLKYMQGYLGRHPEFLLKKNEEGETPLDLAYCLNNTDVHSFLVNYITNCFINNVNAKEITIKEFVFYADLMQHEKLLAKYEEFVDSMGNTLLHYLVERATDSTKYMQALLGRHPELFLRKNMKGVTPLGFASQGGNSWALNGLISWLVISIMTSAEEGLVKEFILYGDLIEHEELLIQQEQLIDNHGNNIFHYLAERPTDASQYMAACLDRHQELVYERNHRGETPRDIANRFSHDWVIKLLMADDKYVKKLLANCELPTASENVDLFDLVYCVTNHTQDLQACLDRHPELINKKKNSETALDLATRLGHSWASNCLIENLGLSPKALNDIDVEQNPDNFVLAELKEVKLQQVKVPLTAETLKMLSEWIEKHPSTARAGSKHVMHYSKSSKSSKSSKKSTSSKSSKTSSIGTRSKSSKSSIGSPDSGSNISVLTASGQITPRKPKHKISDLDELDSDISTSSSSSDQTPRSQKNEVEESNVEDWDISGTSTSSEGLIISSQQNEVESPNTEKLDSSILTSSCDNHETQYDAYESFSNLTGEKKRQEAQAKVDRLISSYDEGEDSFLLAVGEFVLSASVYDWSDNLKLKEWLFSLKMDRELIYTILTQLNAKLREQYSNLSRKNETRLNEFKFLLLANGFLNKQAIQQARLPGDYDLQVMQDTKELVDGVVYLREKEGKVACSFIALNGDIIKDLIINVDIPSLLKDSNIMRDIKPIIIKEALANKHAQSPNHSIYITPQDNQLKKDNFYVRERNGKIAYSRLVSVKVPRTNVKTKILAPKPFNLDEIQKIRSLIIKEVPEAANYKVCLMSSNDIELEENMIYVKEQEGMIAYSMITRQNMPEIDRMTPYDAPQPFSLDKLPAEIQTLASYGLCEMEENQQFEPGKIYLRNCDGVIGYSMITSDGEKVFDVKTSIEAMPLTMDALKKIKPAILEKLKGKNECTLHLMSELPENLVQYKNSYIFIKNDATQELYYIRHDEQYEKVKIGNFKLFEEKINAIKEKDATKLHLSKQQIQEIITANGGHTHQKLKANDPVIEMIYQIVSGRDDSATLNHFYHLSQCAIGVCMSDTPLGEIVKQLNFIYAKPADSAYPRLDKQQKLAANYFIFCLLYYSAVLRIRPGRRFENELEKFLTLNAEPVIGLGEVGSSKLNLSIQSLRDDNKELSDGYLRSNYNLFEAWLSDPRWQLPSFNKLIEDALEAKKSNKRKCSVALVAEEIRRLSFAFYHRADLREFTLDLGKKSNRERVKNLLEYNDLHRKLSNFLISKVFSKKPDQIPNMLKFILELAHELCPLGTEENYPDLHFLSCVAGVLTYEPIARLTPLFDKLSKKQKKHLEVLKNIVDSRGQYPYFQKFAKAYTTCLPYTGLINGLLIRLSESSPIQIFSTLPEIIKPLLTTQTLCLEQLVCHATDIEYMFKEYQMVPEDSFEALSNKIQPKFDFNKLQTELVRILKPLQYRFRALKRELLVKQKSAGQENANQKSAGQENAKQESVGQENAKQESVGQENAKQESAGQENAKQESAGQENAKLLSRRKMENLKKISNTFDEFHNEKNIKLYVPWSTEAAKCNTHEFFIKFFEWFSSQWDLEKTTKEQRKKIGHLIKLIVLYKYKLENHKAQPETINPIHYINKINKLLLLPELELPKKHYLVKPTPKKQSSENLSRNLAPKEEGLQETSSKEEAPKEGDSEQKARKEKNDKEKSAKEEVSKEKVSKKKVTKKRVSKEKASKEKIPQNENAKEVPKKAPKKVSFQRNNSIWKKSSPSVSKQKGGPSRNFLHSPQPSTAASQEEWDLSGKNTPT